MLDDARFRNAVDGTGPFAGKSARKLQVLHPRSDPSRRKHEQGIRFVIPVHRGKIDCLATLLLSIERSAGNEEVCGVVLILTSSEDLGFFKSLLSFLKVSFAIEVLCLRDVLLEEPELTSLAHHLDAGANGAMAVFKKLVGLYVLAREDVRSVLSVCIDVDAVCLRWDRGLFADIRENYVKRLILGCTVPPSSEYFKINDASITHADLSISSQSQAIYSWFFDMPVYETSDLLTFYERMAEKAGLESFFLNLQWHTFEHTMYTFFLVSRGAKIVAYDEVVDKVPEWLSVEQLKIISERFGYKPLWMTTFQARQDSEGLRSFDPYFLSHFDRIVGG